MNKCKYDKPLFVYLNSHNSDALIELSKGIFKPGESLEHNTCDISTLHKLPLAFLKTLSRIRKTYPFALLTPQARQSKDFYTDKTFDLIFRAITAKRETEGAWIIVDEYYFYPLTLIKVEEKDDGRHNNTVR